MALENDFETETMAQIYADQGHLKKAAAIYRRMLMQTPDREDLRKRLARIEDRQKQAAGHHLADQLSEWVELLLKKKEIDRLRKLRKPR